MIGSGVERGELQRRREPRGSLPPNYTVEFQCVKDAKFQNMKTGFQGLHSRIRNGALLHSSVDVVLHRIIVMAYSCWK